jgi:putative aldouronate transport system permease protein
VNTGIKEKNNIQLISSIKENKFKTLIKNVKAHKLLYAMMIPGIVFFILFHYLPMGGLIIAFKDFNFNKGILGSPWVGFKYFKILFSSQDFFQIFWNTIILNIYGLIFNFPGPIILALLINEVKNVFFKRTVQTVVYFPHFLSWIIVGGIAFKFFNLDGNVNKLITGLGMEAIPFLTSPKYFRSIFTLSGMWKEIGWNTIIYLAAITAIDQSLFEAAIVDGASKFKQILYITIPCIAPTIIVVLILRMGNMLSVGFEHVFVLYNPFVYSVSDVFSTYIYRVGIQQARFSYSTAIGMFQSVIGFTMVLTANKLANKYGDSGIW